MPRNPKYPLEPLREHRDRSVEAATVQLASAVRTRETADEAKRLAEEQRQLADARAETVRKDEAERLAKGDLRVADLARAQAWEHAATAERVDLTRAIARADGQIATASDAEEEARAQLAAHKAALDVVAKDKARFVDRLQRAGEAADEEAADEVLAARRRNE